VTRHLLLLVAAALAAAATAGLLYAAQVAVGAAVNILQIFERAL